VGDEQKETNTSPALGRRVCRGAQVPGQTEKNALLSMHKHTHTPRRSLSFIAVCNGENKLKAAGERKNPLLIRLSANSNNPLWLAASRNQQQSEFPWRLILQRHMHALNTLAHTCMYERMYIHGRASCRRTAKMGHCDSSAG
jgi:hypothetical protein